MAPDAGDTSFSAVDSMTGYIYQIRYALLEAVRRLPEGQDLQVGIETLDDVTIDSVGDPIELLQLKQHGVKRQARLTNASPDLWKTLRIWIETAGSSDGDRRLFLVTTAQAPGDSAASLLRTIDRSVERARILLANTATSSTNQENAHAYSLFLGLRPSQQARFLEQIVIVDAAPTVFEVDSIIKRALYFVVSSSYRSAFLERLEGWWYRRVIRHLDDRQPIHGAEISAVIDDLRDQLANDNLPIDEVDALLAEHEGAEEDYLHRVFVHQLKLIRVTHPRLLTAIKDWMSAYAQRSRWVREQLIVTGELSRFERRLVDEWHRYFLEMQEELGPGAAEDQMVTSARALYSWAQQLSIQLRPRCNEPFLVRGSFHMLADDQRIGWHPQYEERLKSLLEGGVTVP
jgi:hypothetical protein